MLVLFISTCLLALSSCYYHTALACPVLNFSGLHCTVLYLSIICAVCVQALDNGYECVQGGSMLVEQGVQQFHIWHKRRAPYSVMKEAVFRDIETLDD